MLQGKTFIAKTASIIAVCGIIGMSSVALAQSDTQTPATEAEQHRVFLPLVSSNNVGGNQQMGINGGIDPNHVVTQEEVAAIAKKDALAEQYMQDEFQKLVGQVSAAYLQTKTVSLEQQWKEPNDWPHRNYCGPGSTQVALDARLPKAQVPNIDTLGSEEGIDPNWGVTMNSIRNVLNTRLNTSFYVVSAASGSSQLTTWIKSDVDSGYALITGVNAKGMPGWSLSTNTPHIVAVVGYTQYVESSGIYFANVIYSETASATAGYSGAFQQQLGLSTMWSFVSQNNSQAW